MPGLTAAVKLGKTGPESPPASGVGTRRRNIKNTSPVGTGEV